MRIFGIKLKLIFDRDSLQPVSEMFGPDSETPADVFLKVDAGAHRLGVDITSDEKINAAAAFANACKKLFGERLRGILAYTGLSYQAEGGWNEIARFDRIYLDRVEKFADVLKKKYGVKFDQVIFGGTPAALTLPEGSMVTEVISGSGTVNDATNVGLGTVGPRQCALTVVTAATKIDQKGRRVLLDVGKRNLGEGEGPGGRGPANYGCIYTGWGRERFMQNCDGECASINGASAYQSVVSNLAPQHTPIVRLSNLQECLMSNQPWTPLLVVPCRAEAALQAAHGFYVTFGKQNEIIGRAYMPTSREVEHLLKAARNGVRPAQ